MNIAPMTFLSVVLVLKIDERGARAKYKTAAKAAKSQSIKDMFEKLAYEEEVHLDVLERFERDPKALLAEEKKR